MGDNGLTDCVQTADSTLRSKREGNPHWTLSLGQDQEQAVRETRREAGTCNHGSIDRGQNLAARRTSHSTSSTQVCKGLPP